MRRRLRIIAGCLGVIGLISCLTSIWLTPTTLRIAVGPLAGSDTRVMMSFAQALQREGAMLRLRLVPTESAMASGVALDEGRADLAVARPDAGLPVQSATVAILRRDAVYFIARSGIAHIPDLRARRIGVIAERPANDRILANILDNYDLAEADVSRIALPQPELVQAVQEGRLDAVFLVAPLGDRLVRQVQQGFAAGTGKPPQLLAITEAAALVTENPFFDTVDIPRGAFGTNPAVPDEDETTLAVTHRLVARRDIDENTISELTQLLFNLRLQIAVEVPAANQIEIPSTEARGARLPVHPGTIAYAEGETKSFLDRYGDWFYFGIMVISLVGSAVAALLSGLIGPHKGAHPDAFLKQLLHLLQAAGAAQGDAALREIEREAEKTVLALMAAMARGEADAGRIAAMGVLNTELRLALAKRRAALAQGAAGPSPLRE